MVNKQHFVFLRKGTMIVPQSLDDAESGEVIKSLIQQKIRCEPIARVGPK